MTIKTVPDGIIEIKILVETESTNLWLLQQARSGAAKSGTVCIADRQTGGRGRRGKLWVSPPGNLYLSLLWRLEENVPVSGLLAICAGVVVARVLESLGIQNVQLKWPNDVWVKQKKIGGLLIETESNAAGQLMVIGIGLNLVRTKTMQQQIGQSWIALEEISEIAHLDAEKISRDVIAELILKELVPIVAQFAKKSTIQNSMQNQQTQIMKNCRQDWQKFDAVNGKSVQIYLENRTVEGIAQGIDENGAIRVQTDSSIETFFSGDLSLRLQKS